VNYEDITTIISCINPSKQDSSNHNDFIQLRIPVANSHSRFADDIFFFDGAKNQEIPVHPMKKFICFDESSTMKERARVHI